MADITDKFGKASIDTDYAQATTVKTARTPSETVLAAFDLSKFPTDTPVYFITYKKEVDPVTNEATIVNQTSWKALVNPDINTLTNLTLAPGYVDTGNEVGDYIESVPTSHWGNDLVEGLLVSHNPDGTLKGGWQDWTPSVSASGAMTLSNITTDFARFTIIGKTVHYTMRAFFDISGTPSATVYLSLPIAAKYTLNLATGGCIIRDTPSVFVPGTALHHEGTQILVRRSDGTSWSVGNDRRIYIGGTYEID